MLAHMRAAVLERGVGWLEDQVWSSLPLASVTVGAPGSRRVSKCFRPPERPNPDVAMLAQRRQHGPNRCPPVPAAKCPQCSSCRSGRNPTRQPSLAAEEAMAVSVAAPPQCRNAADGIVASPSDAPIGKVPSR